MAGAPKGNTNRKGKGFKASLDVLATIHRLGCDPIENLCRLSQIAFETDDFNLAFNCNKELAQYVAPKRKAVEHTGEGGGPLAFTRIERVIIRPDDKDNL